MDHDDSDRARRALLQLAAGLAASPALAAPAKARPPAPTGQPGDFAFLTGEWKIRQRRRKDGGWDEFDGEATVWGLLDGVVSVEELRIPARNFSGMGLRLLDREKKLWADHWVNSRGAVLAPEPSWGSFVDGVGTWDGDDTDSGQPVIWRGQWDQITPRSCRWLQAVSRDGGQRWEEHWVMHWSRA